MSYYIARCLGGSERTASDQLRWQNPAAEVYYPKMAFMKILRTSHKPSISYQPAFCGYLFVQQTHDIFERAERAPAVLGFVNLEGEPATVGDLIIAELKAREREWLRAPVGATKAPLVGQPVIIKEGPLAALPATVVSISKGRVTLALNTPARCGLRVTLAAKDVQIFEKTS